MRQSADVRVNATTDGPFSWLAVLLTVLFVGLKLTGHIDWSWWWVLSPIWVSIAVGVVVFGLAFILISRMR
jgi:hypothetical protein